MAHQPGPVEDGQGFLAERRPRSLNDLPDEIIIDVISHLNAARDFAALGQASPRTHSIVERDGWKTFVKQCFESSRPTQSPGADWMTLADRLTYLDRCWEKRGFLFHTFKKERTRRRPSGGQTLAVFPSLDARILSGHHNRELLVWGAGEDIVTRVSGTGSDRYEQWNSLKGSGSEVSDPLSDITSVSIIDRGRTPEILAGRANGEMQLLEATGDRFGVPTQTLLPSEDQASDTQLGKKMISWTEWDPATNLVATGSNSRISLHNLGGSLGKKELGPIAHYNLSGDGASDEYSLVRGIKFLSNDTVACALGSSRRPLRWGKLLPTGLEFFDAAENYDPLEYLASKTYVAWDRLTTVRAIEKVGHGSSESLILSAWDDGTYRLADVRTPSPYDAVYRDQWDPYVGGHSLLVYGTRHFVAGSKDNPNIQLFDFRNPSPYHHTNGLACSPEPPNPGPPFGLGGEIGSRGEKRAGECRHTLHDPQPCVFHDRSRMDIWRPDATLRLTGDRNYSRVDRLVKSSDTSGRFYCSLSATVAQVDLRLAEDVTEPDLKRTAPRGWQVRRPRGQMTLAETGVSLCRRDEWMRQDRQVPILRSQHQQRPGKGGKPGIHNRNRLDSSYDIRR